jgi:hypothetical protein
MRRPRIEDYDPNAKLPELASPIDGMPVIGKPPQKIKEASPTSLQEKPAIQEEQANQARPERANARTPVRPNGKRIITRNAFEIYEDQMDTLRKVSREEKMNGKLGSMSAMVREAIDSYLQKKVFCEITLHVHRLTGN